MSAGVAHVITGSIFVIVHVAVAGVGSTLPAWSFARTANVWLVRLKPENNTGLVHEEKAPPSRLHSKLSAPVAVKLSKPSKSKLADVFVVLEPSEGPLEMVVSGGVTSIVQANEAALWSVLPAASVAATVKRCSPAARPE